MPTPILMPALSPTMEEGTLAKWNVKEGDKVSSGDVIAEIETDKATMEVEAVDEGVVGKIVVPAGTENVKVNATIAILLEEGESAGDIGKAAPPPKTNGGAAPRESNGGGQATSAPRSPAPPLAGELSAKRTEGDALHPQAQDSRRAPPPSPSATPPPQAGEEKRRVPSDGRLRTSPLAKRMAKDAGLDLAALKGTGPHGRIVKRDIEAAGKGGVAARAPQDDARKPAAVDPRLYPPESYTAVKLDGMRKTIARRLKQSFNDDVPHFPLNIDIELTKLLEARAALNVASPKEGENAYKLSVNDFVLKASAMALMKVPNANASYTDEAILLHKHADIGVAVAIDNGLITPIIWKAETKGLKRISAEVKDLASRARARKLKPEEYMGGTFSVSNLGMFGITSFASIVNEPQGAILSVGVGEERPVVRDGQIVVRTMMTVTLTCDHRVVDGAVGAEFLAAFKQFIEEPASMLL